jgi:predicted ATPase
VVLLAGEPGIGKSRIARALRERLARELHTCVRCDASPYHQTSPLRPVIAQLKRAAGFGHDDPPARKLDKLEALLAGSAENLGEVAPLFAALLSLPTGDRYPPLALSPPRQKERTLAALVD